MQRRYLQALIEGFDPDHPGYVPDSNPVSEVYGGRMIDLGRLHVYAWDARPYPAFPNDRVSWGDGANWRFGHWLNGRFSSLPLNEAVARILRDFDFAHFDVGDLDGIVPGYVIDRIMAAREALQPLELAYFFDAIESGGRIAMRHRGRGKTVVDLTADTLVESEPGAALISLTRGQETELPASAKLRFVDAASDYRNAVAEARKRTGLSTRVAKADLALMLEADQAGAMAESWLHEAWAARDHASFQLPPSQLAVEPGDLVAVDVGGARRPYRVVRISDHGAREVEAQSIDPAVYVAAGGPERTTATDVQPVVGQADVLFMDLPLLKGNEPDTAGYVAVAQAPWPGDVAVFRSPDAAGFELAGVVSVPATIGVTLSVLPAGPEGRFDRATRLRVRLNSGSLQSVTQLRLFAGANAAAVRNGSGAWEVLQFETATLIAPLTYELSGLLRGQSGTEDQMSPEGVAEGAAFVLLDGAVTRLDLTRDQLALPLNWRIGPARHDIGHASYRQATHAFVGFGQRPFSPVHVCGVRDDGDLTISWIRRTRVGGDNWDGDDVALGEETERYEVDILNAGTVVRTLRSDVPQAIYARDEQMADFGAVPAEITCRVYQMSRTWGRGAVRFATV